MHILCQNCRYDQKYPVVSLLSVVIPVGVEHCDGRVRIFQRRSRLRVQLKSMIQVYQHICVYLSPIQIQEQNQNIIIQLITINETEEIIRDPKKYAPYSFDTDKLKKIEY